MIASIIPALLVLYVEGSLANENVPFIAWSNQRFLEGIPTPPAGTIIDSQHGGPALVDSLSQDDQLIVLFKFNKMSVDDISKYGGVYQQNSDGGSLSNFKNAYENSASQLPLLTVEKSVTQEVLDKSTVISFDDDWSNKLSKGITNLLLVPLELTSNSAASLRKADERMGKVLEVVSDLGKKYTAILTAAMPNRIPPNEDDEVDMLVGRHLLATGGTNYTQVVSFTDNGCASLFYVSRIDITTGDIKNTTLETSTKWDVTKSNCSDPTAIKLVMSSSFGEEITSFELAFNITKVKTGYYWNFKESSAAYKKKDQNQTQFQFNITATDTPANYSYHCGDTVILDKNSTTTIKLVGFQIQPFGVKEEKFNRAHDCIGFFTEGIWMGLIVTLILVSILYFGVSMLASLTVMDQFDDPKGKTITVNAAD